ncbi:MAG TPA: ATP-binding cassette domain-containing protein [Gemmata sp.]|nr:ATP-binding cassette domain-containing protein [Gemmata sp.]
MSARAITTMATAAINVRNLTKRYGTVLAVDDVSFQVQPGELVGFLGPNGAGKTTCMRILTTWIPASSGYAWLSGFDVMYQSMDVRKRVGYLPESVPLYPELRVREYLTYRAKIKGVARAGRTARIDYCLEKCRIKEVQNRLLGTLSKGYRQRVGLADAMLADPQILILDEPTSGLDPLQISETLNTIKELGGKHTILLSTHILSEVEKICERVIIINKGQIKFDDTMKSIENREPTLLIEIRGPGEATGRFLQEQPELSSVVAKHINDDLTLFELKTKDKYKDFREELARRIASKQWGIRRLDLRRESLENLFAAVVLQKSEPAVPPPTQPSEPISVPVA